MAGLQPTHRALIELAIRPSPTEFGWMSNSVPSGHYSQQSWDTCIPTQRRVLYRPFDKSPKFLVARSQPRFARAPDLLGRLLLRAVMISNRAFDYEAK